MDRATVRVVIKGATQTYRFEAEQISSQLWDSGRAQLTLSYPDTGMQRVLHFRRAEMIDVERRAGA